MLNLLETKQNIMGCRPLFNIESFQEFLNFVKISVNAIEHLLSFAPAMLGPIS